MGIGVLQQRRIYSWGKLQIGVGMYIQQGTCFPFHCDQGNDNQLAVGHANPNCQLATVRLGGFWIFRAVSWTVEGIVY